MDAILSIVISYVTSYFCNEHTNSAQEQREKDLEKQLAKTKAISAALSSQRSLQEEISITCNRLAQHRAKLRSTEHDSLWKLLIDDSFQQKLAEWLMTSDLEEGEASKRRLYEHIRDALCTEGRVVSGSDANNFFQQVERAVFSNELIARWRHQLSLDYLRRQVSELRTRANEAAGIFDPSRQQQALTLYCNEAFKAWDIIDLTNLPEGDVDIATQNLLVRQLYMPLRIALEHPTDSETDASELEHRRHVRRLREAGHWIDDEDAFPEGEPNSTSVGQLLAEHKRMVVLGDPGGGKTTMLRWLATAMLLKQRDVTSFTSLPDVHTLPDCSWIPVFIRCRDLGDIDLCRSFSDFLAQHLLKTTLDPADALIIKSIVLDRIGQGQILLLIDGLDEITNSRVRVRFCQEIERTAARYPAAPIIVTSRIVGYRDMPFRMGNDFIHGAISELDREHKDLFAKRWIQVTEQKKTPVERAKNEKELIEALHASNRIERLTGNPMLLTTLALVKRKVGKLPSRRNKLYAEAVAVLLNWNPSAYERIEEQEALPQLEYIAFEMCRRGIQQITDDDLMDLLERFRTEYPAVRAARNHTEREFLELLEARSSILVKAGSLWRKNSNKTDGVWEFRHLTFQEYLAAQALLDGKYPGREKGNSLASQVGPLAGSSTLFADMRELVDPAKMPDAWRETIRLLVADCRDDDVDEVLAAILGAPDENNTNSRAILAALCLADEPNVSEDMASLIIHRFVQAIGADDSEIEVATPITQAAVELGRSQWYPFFENALVNTFIASSPSSRSHFGSIWATVVDQSVSYSKGDSQQLSEALAATNPVSTISTALGIMESAFNETFGDVGQIPELLLQLCGRSEAECQAAVWALGWLAASPHGTDIKRYWKPDPVSISTLKKVLHSTNDEQTEIQFWILRIFTNVEHPDLVNWVAPYIFSRSDRPRTAAVSVLQQIGSAEAIEALATALLTSDVQVVNDAAIALGKLGDSRSRPILLKLWHDNSRRPKVEAIVPTGSLSAALLATEPDELKRKLLSENLDGTVPFLLQLRVRPRRITAAAEKFQRTEEEIRSIYSSLAREYALEITSR